MDISKTIREQISAFSDHELSPSILPVDALRSAEGEHAWHAYHRIGDVIRDQGAPHLSDGFAGKLAARLAAEPAPATRTVRVSGEALGRRAPLATPVALAAGVAGPVTGIAPLPGDAASGAASRFSDMPLDPDGQALTEAPEEALATLDAGAVVTDAAAAEASIAPGAEALSMALVKTVVDGAADPVPDADAGSARAATTGGAGDGKLDVGVDGADDGRADGVADGMAGPRTDGAHKPSVGSLT